MTCFCDIPCAQVRLLKTFKILFSLQNTFENTYIFHSFFFHELASSSVNVSFLTFGMEVCVCVFVHIMQELCSILLKYFPCSIVLVILRFIGVTTFILKTNFILIFPLGENWRFSLGREGGSSKGNVLVRLC